VLVIEFKVIVPENQLRQINNVICMNFWISPCVKNLSNRCQAFVVRDVRVKTYDVNSNKNRSFRKPPHVFEFVQKVIDILKEEGHPETVYFFKSPIKR